MLAIVKDIFNQIKEGLAEMPAPIKKFALRALLLFIGWQFVYLIFLLPGRVVDKPLTDLVANLSIKLLSFFYPNSNFSIKYSNSFVWNEAYLETTHTAIMQGQKGLINIADSCNGLSLYLLFLGFIIVYSKALPKKILFGLFGLIGIFGVNVLRCTGLAIVSINYPDFTVYAHHYIFNISTYLVVILLWVKFAKF